MFESRQHPHEKQLNSSYVLASLGWLYLVQGIPYGLQDKFIPLQLRAHGLDYSSVGWVKAVLVPWVSKGVWAPLLQVYGNSRQWLLVALLVLAAAALAGSVCDVTRDLVPVCGVLLLLNVGCAVQDVVVDGLAMQLLAGQQLGLVNSLQVVLYKVGSLFGGGGLLLLLSVSSWRACLLLLAAVYLASAVWAATLPLQTEDKYCEVAHTSGRAGVSNEVVTPFGETRLEEENSLENDVCDDRSLYDEVQNHSRVKTNAPNIESEECSKAPYFWDSSNDVINKACNKGKIYSIFSKVFSAQGTLWLAVYVALYKMGERGAINNFPLFLLDSGVSMNELAFWNGSVCQVLSILGSIYGGVVLARPSSNINSLLVSHSIQRSIAILFQYLCIHYSPHFTPMQQHFDHYYYYSCLFSLCYLSYSTGVISTLTFTLMMRYSRQLPSALQTSHYSMFASIEVAGKLAFATVAGAVVDSVGLTGAFALFAALSVVPIVLLIVERKHHSGKSKPD